MPNIGLENLRVYQLAEKGSVDVYNVTKKFPSGEWLKGRSVDQLRRSSESVANNVSEAYRRNSTKDKLRILRDIARGETDETKFGLIRCMKKEFVPASELQPIINLYTEFQKTLSGYIQYIKQQAESPNPDN